MVNSLHQEFGRLFVPSESFCVCFVLGFVGLVCWGF